MKLPTFASQEEVPEAFASLYHEVDGSWVPIAEGGDEDLSGLKSALEKERAIREKAEKAQKAADKERAELEKSLKRLESMFSEEERAKYRLVPAVRCGIATEVILDYVNASSVDLIVMGAKGRSAIANILMGSVAKDLMQKAPCPVVTVRKPH